MATKRFDDVAEKARALEAQAKKLRREARAARTKAYADALVTVFPEVKGMGSAEEVLDFVKGLKPGTGHGTPDACSALLDDFRVANDPLRQFADEIFPAASWHLLPCKFLYDLYRHWFQRNQPSGRMLGRNAFYESIEGLAEEQGWQLQERVRSTGRMDFPRAADSRIRRDGVDEQDLSRVRYRPPVHAGAERQLSRIRAYLDRLLRRRL